MYLCPVVTILSFVYKTALAADRKKEGAGQHHLPVDEVADLSTSSAKHPWKDALKQSALVNKLQRDADLHNSILMDISQSNHNRAHLRQRRRRAPRIAAKQMQRRDMLRSSETAAREECDPDAIINAEEPDTGILSHSFQSCPKNQVCIPTESSMLGGVCEIALPTADKRDVSSSTAHRDLETTDKDFCECLFYGDPLDDAACFNSVVGYCTGSTPPACLEYDDVPYVWAYCDYFRW
jgi:hypothetical protein